MKKIFTFHITEAQKGHLKIRQIKDDEATICSWLRHSFLWLRHFLFDEFLNVPSGLPYHIAYSKIYNHSQGSGYDIISKLLTH